MNDSGPCIIRCTPPSLWPRAWVDFLVHPGEFVPVDQVILWASREWDVLFLGGGGQYGGQVVCGRWVHSYTHRRVDFEVT